MFHSSELLLSWSSRLLLVWDKMLLLACCLWTNKLLINGRLDDTLDFSLIALVFKPTDTTQLIILSPPSQQNLISHCIVLSFFPFFLFFSRVLSQKSKHLWIYLCSRVHFKSACKFLCGDLQQWFSNCGAGATAGEETWRKARLS